MKEKEIEETMKKYYKMIKWLEHECLDLDIDAKDIAKMCSIALESVLLSIMPKRKKDV